MIIAIDFDGTLVSHEFPKIGKDIGAVPVLKKLVDAGHKLILHTMRSDIDEVKSFEYGIHGKPGKYLTEAVEWCKVRDIHLWGINENPEQLSWTNSPKPYAHIYIDDAALGCPLKCDHETERPYVDWKRIEEELKIREII